jgi:nitric oxide reductase subunit B
LCRARRGWAFFQGGEKVSYKRLWVALAVVIIGSFAVLGGVGVQMISNAPPIPRQVATADGRVLFDHDHVQAGQGGWQSLGGQEIGLIWGHGANVAPDWTADWFHREATLVLDAWARGEGFRGAAGGTAGGPALAAREGVPHQHV